MGVDPVVRCSVGMTVAVDVDGPDVVTVLRQKIHQRVVADRQGVERTASPLGSMDEERNFPGTGEIALLFLPAFFPQSGAKAIPHGVVFFALNGGGGTRAHATHA